MFYKVYTCVMTKIRAFSHYPITVHVFHNFRLHFAT